LPPPAFAGAISGVSGVVASVEPWLLVAVTLTRSVLPTSAVIVL